MGSLSELRYRGNRQLPRVHLVPSQPAPSVLRTILLQSWTCSFSLFKTLQWPFVQPWKAPVPSDLLSPFLHQLPPPSPHWPDKLQLSTALWSICLALGHPCQIFFASSFRRCRGHLPQENFLVFLLSFLFL